MKPKLKAGRPRGEPTKVQGIRVTRRGWKWLKSKAAPMSVGKWADTNAAN